MRSGTRVVMALRFWETESGDSRRRRSLREGVVVSQSRSPWPRSHFLLVTYKAASNCASLAMTRGGAWTGQIESAVWTCRRLFDYK